MKKRSLADQLQAWRAEEEEGASAPVPSDTRAGLGRRAPSAASESNSDEEPDYMSDAFLAQLEERDAPRQLTYAEKRAKALREHQEHQRREMEEADARRSKRQRGPLAGEEEARQVGMAVNVLERAAAPADSEAPQAGSGTSAAVRMMLAMGYKPGTALGSDATAASSEPIAPDQRWLSHAGDTGPRRLGIGHASLSQQIAEAASQAPVVHDDPETEADRFRQGKAAEAAQRHTEQVLRKARQICRELDEEDSVDVGGRRTCSKVRCGLILRRCRPSMSITRRRMCGRTSGGRRMRWRCWRMRLHKERRGARTKRGKATRPAARQAALQATLRTRRRGATMLECLCRRTTMRRVQVSAGPRPPMPSVPRRRRRRRECRRPRSAVWTRRVSARCPPRRAWR